MKSWALMVLCLGIIVAGVNAAGAESLAAEGPGHSAAMENPGSVSGMDDHHRGDGMMMGRGNRMGDGMMMERRMEEFHKRLGLTEDQLKDMRTQLAAFKDKTRKARTTLISLFDEKKTMLLSGKIDLEKMAKIDDEIVKTESEINRDRLKFMRDRLASLTPEQLTKLADLVAKKEFRHFFSGMMGKGKHRNMFH